MYEQAFLLALQYVQSTAVSSQALDDESWHAPLRRATSRHLQVNGRDTQMTPLLRLAAVLKPWTLNLNALRCAGPSRGTCRTMAGMGR